MKTRAAVLHDVGEKWQIEQIDLDPPKSGEVLLRMTAAGLCHSDDHLVTGDMAVPNALSDAKGIPRMFPMIGGHEGSAVVESVGPDVTSVVAGDHVVTTFVPACGHCHYCTSGRMVLCDNTGFLFTPGQITDHTSRHWLGGQELALYSKVGSFAEHTVVAERSVVKIPDHIPLDLAALVSCGVPTGWGSAVRRAEVRPGDIVVVMGVGGVGMNAVQGAHLAGARIVVAVDPVVWKGEMAVSTFGATHHAPSLRDALPLLREISWGRLADKVICTPGVLKGADMGEVMSLVGKGGTCVVTGMAANTDKTVTLNLQQLAFWNKEIRGALFGSMSPHHDVPMLLSLWEAGRLKLEELISRRYTLDEINQGYDDIRDGRNLRGVIVF